MKNNLPWICIALAFTSGIFAGWVDFNNDEPQAAVVVILALTFALGMALPRLAWMWALVVALCIPGVYLLLHGLGYQPVSPPSPGWYASLLALIPAFLGSYLGALGRLMMKNVLSKPEHPSRQ